MGSKSVGDPIISSGNQVFLWEVAGGEAEDQPLVLRQSGHEIRSTATGLMWLFHCNSAGERPSFCRSSPSSRPASGVLGASLLLPTKRVVPPGRSLLMRPRRRPEWSNQGACIQAGGQVIQGLGSLGSGMQNKVAIQQASLPNRSQCGLISETS